jgi:hypothetical protein
MIFKGIIRPVETWRLLVFIRFERSAGQRSGIHGTHDIPAGKKGNFKKGYRTISNLLI